jgi:hypothetical protein
MLIYLAFTDTAVAGFSTSAGRASGRIAPGSATHDVDERASG